MNGIRRFGSKTVAGLCMLLIVFTGTSYALEISLEPAAAQRDIGKKVRVQIYATDASELISMGVKVSFDPAILQVFDAQKNTFFATGFVMDADGVEGTTGDQYVTPPVEIDPSAGTVVMIGGRLMGDVDTSGDSLSGKVLIGWIDFIAIGNGNSALNVDLGRYHPNHPTDTFDNFVQINGTVDEPTNVPDNLGMICIRDNPCEGNLNNDNFSNLGDVGILKAAFGTTGCNDPGNNCPEDLNGDGFVNLGDVGILKADFGRTDCKCE